VSGALLQREFRGECYYPLAKVGFPLDQIAHGHPLSAFVLHRFDDAFKNARLPEADREKPKKFKGCGIG